MKVSTFLVIAAVFHGIYALESLLAPGQVFALYDLVLNDDGQLMARVSGAVTIGLAAIFWQVRKAENSPTLRAILFGSMIYLFIEVVVLVVGLLAGVVSALSLGSIIADLLLAVGFGYFYFQLSRSSTAH